MKEARQEGTNPEEFHSYEVPRGTKSIGKDSRVVGTGGGDGGRVCQGDRVSVWEDGRSGDDGGEAGQHVRVLTVPQLCTEFRKVNSVSCLFHHDCKAGGEAQRPRSWSSSSSWQRTVGSCCLSG